MHHSLFLITTITVVTVVLDLVCCATAPEEAFVAEEDVGWHRETRSIRLLKSHGWVTSG